MKKSKMQGRRPMPQMPMTPQQREQADPDKEDSKKIPIPPRKDGSGDSGEIEIKWKIF